MLNLLTASDNATGATVTLKNESPQGRRTCTVFAWGTFGGGTVQVQVSLDNSEWFDVTSGSFSAKGYLTFDIAAPYIRANLTGATGGAVNAAVNY